MPDTIEVEELRYSDTSSPCTIEYYFDIFFLFSCNTQSIDESCEHDDSRTVLVIVHNGDVELLLESVFYLETSWSSYIFEIDTTETIGNIFDCCDELLDILSPDNNRECINSGKFLE